MEVATVFADLWQVGFPATPQIAQVAKVAKVGWKYAAKVVDEITITGDLIDPDIQKFKKLNKILPDNEANFCRRKKRYFCFRFGLKMQLALY
jgi:hypothetical protein